MGIYDKTMRLLLIALVLVRTGFAQIGIGTATPDTNAVLTISSTTRGVLIPRLSTAQQTVLAATLSTGQTGMLITDAASGLLWVWQGRSFVSPANLSGKAPVSVSATNEVSLNPGTNIGDLITWDGNNWVNMQPVTQHFSIQVNNLQPFVAVNYCIALKGIFPVRSDAMPLISQIQIFAFDFAPTGWAQCNGQLLAVSQNIPLYAVMGNPFGGDGRSTFALPDLSGRIPVGKGPGPGGSYFVTGEMSGSATETVAQ